MIREVCRRDWLNFDLLVSSSSVAQRDCLLELWSLVAVVTCCAAVMAEVLMPRAVLLACDKGPRGLLVPKVCTGCALAFALA